jgi:ABC-2 type transport system permease protein
MTATLARLTARQLLGRRRGWLVVLLALIPVLVAMIYRFGSDRTDPVPIEFAPDVLDLLMITAVLPLTALVFGTSALGGEIEDGTAVYLLTTPVERWRILLVKVAVASGATIVVVLPATVLTSVIALGGDEHGLTPGFALGVIAGSVVYCCVFVALSVWTSRALLIGLAYVFVWEGVVTSIFDGTRWVSVRQYVLGLADLVSSAPEFALEADLGGVSALVASAVLSASAIWLGIRLLKRFEIGQRL